MLSERGPGQAYKPANDGEMGAGMTGYLLDCYGFWAEDGGYFGDEGVV